MTNSEQPAHPVSDGANYGNGLTKREYFAGLAMQAMIGKFANDLSKVEANVIADQSIQFADQLLNQLEK